ncbi:MAG: hypothetical protein QME81_18585, partial [bacterium]|nr:hypothetical protein [bacterium]
WRAESGEWRAGEVSTLNSSLSTLTTIPRNIEKIPHLHCCGANIEFDGDLSGHILQQERECNHVIYSSCYSDKNDGVGLVHRFGHGPWFTVNSLRVAFYGLCGLCGLVDCGFYPY